jgi:AcrR family transcriptional regulator
MARQTNYKTDDVKDLGVKGNEPDFPALVVHGRTEWDSARSKQFNARRDAVISVASALFEARGFAGVSLADIARELGITNNALYHYFGSKEELAFICSDRALDRIDTYLDKAEEGGDSGLQQLQTFIGLMLAEAPGGPPLPLRMLYGLGEESRTKITQKDQRQRARLLRIVRAGTEDGSLHTVDPVLTVDFLYAGTFSMYRRCQRGTADLSQVMEVVTSVLHGVSTEPSKRLDSQ